MYTAGQARREKISERMKILQDLVPGCNKVWFYCLLSFVSALSIYIYVQLKENNALCFLINYSYNKSSYFVWFRLLGKHRSLMR